MTVMIVIMLMIKILISGKQKREVLGDGQKTVRGELSDAGFCRYHYHDHDYHDHYYCYQHNLYHIDHQVD